MKKILIAGPCSAESFEQLEETYLGMKDLNITAFRAGVWKPRTMAGGFEGYGEEALKWLKQLKDKYNIKIATEVANKNHVELALKYDVDYLWIGARTSGNPFSVQEIAEALENTEKTVLVKNPMNPDVALWAGAFNRLKNKNINNLIAIHRGFSSYHKTKYRNEPIWDVLRAFREKLPDMPIIVDPSHISGKKELIEEVCQDAQMFHVDGFMIETHCNPVVALSDKEQQVTPVELVSLVERLKEKRDEIPDTVKGKIDSLRYMIDSLDYRILECLARRFEVSKQIGEVKKQNDVNVYQEDRFKQVINDRRSFSKKEPILSQEFIEELYKLIHDESIRVQKNE
jgi:chorismate mutase